VAVESGDAADDGEAVRGVGLVEAEREGATDIWT